MNLRKIIKEEMDDIQWIRDAEPSKWDLFQEIIKDKPNINIQISNDGIWHAFIDENYRKYFDWEFFDEYNLKADIKENDMGEFLNALSQHIEDSFGYGENSKDYRDFKELESILEYVNNQPI
jgi:hypothetical protein